MIASEVRSRESDYNRFADGGAIPTSLRTDSLPPDFDPELSSIARSMLGDTTPDGVYQVSMQSTPLSLEVYNCT